MPELSILQEYGIVDLKDGIIIPNRKKMWILKELYNEEVLSYSYVNSFEKELDDFMEQGLIRFGSSFFSEPEMDYYNYLFNRHGFSNSLDIRNRYMHGNQKIEEQLLVQEKMKVLHLIQSNRFSGVSFLTLCQIFVIA